MSEDDLIEASPCKLRNGDWGCKTQEPVQVGDAVQIVTRANKQWFTMAKIYRGQKST